MADAKSPSGPSTSFDDDETAPPPSYTDSIDSINTSSYYSTQIRSQLLTLTHQISSLQTQKSLLSDAQDEKILSLLTSEIQIYLSSFANSGLQRGTLILVPAGGLTDENALPTDYDFKRADEYDMVVRVRTKDVECNDKFELSSSNSGDLMYWRDEDMAQRLAGYLKPLPDQKTVELPPRKTEPVSQPGDPKVKGFWGSRKKSAPGIPTTAVAVETGTMKMGVNEATKDKVLMDVKAEEVVFRTENEFGIYEMQTGWGILLKLRVVLAGDRR